MKVNRWTFAVALAGAGVWCTCNAFSQDAGDAMSGANKAAQEQAMQDGMKAMEDTSTPGPMHRVLERLVGTWSAETTIFGMGPPAKSMGTAEWRSLLDGRFVQLTWSGEMMGAPASGQITMGYDIFKRKFVTSDVNTFRTAIFTSVGSLDESGNTLTTWGFADSPMTGERDRVVKYVWRFDGPDKVTFELHDPAAGDANSKVLEVAYARKK